MKMRKKLAALLATAMVASVMPMTAFAASTNRVDRGIVKVAKDSPVRGSNLVIDLDDELTSGEAFYLELENAEWAADIATAPADPNRGNVTLKRVGDKTLEVKGTTAGEAKKIIVPLNVKATGGEASVTIDSYGSAVTGGKFVFAVSEDAKAKVTVGDLSTIVDRGKIATITIEEPYKGAFESELVNNKVEIMVELDDSDFDFVAPGSVAIKRGFSGVIATEILSNG